MNLQDVIYSTNSLSKRAVTFKLGWEVIALDKLGSTESLPSIFLEDQSSSGDLIKLMCGGPADQLSNVKRCSGPMISGSSLPRARQLTEGTLSCSNALFHATEKPMVGLPSPTRPPAR
ncbi:hypothetical protein PAAG_07310 [Paracoccidioides lutzii Pb01]|uniref:Uncharacterized protein n=1 Tax=Paracoccidioides lutzii (strain ATCC MYA-826 / Pb01) TaxID=502779 RepID=C1H969_PARBA|nr:hypothetical protein PAAG_07310 [Paracoccidioides lutzii Pb01]EEH36892.2 hypothetical protein PAAG_07310 [Paracoccidioides lutzii Pb01]